MSRSLTDQFREPVNGFMHLGALILSVVGTVLLALRVAPDGARLAAVLIYGTAMCGCFLASTLHHLIQGRRETEVWLWRLDHAAIYSFIAGCYTPVCLVMLPGTSGLVLLGVVWLLALGGIAYKLCWAPAPVSVADPPELASTMVYVLMGWLMVGWIGEIAAHALPWTLPMVVAGGLAYTVGGLILSRRWLDFWPGRWGHHEFWHVCVMLGAAGVYGFLYFNLQA